jgi:hypothetical protein
LDGREQVTPRHIAKTFVNPHFAPDNYKNSVEHIAEKKVELFCKKIKDRLLGKVKDGNQSKD